jgi:hypothetical protein
MNTPRHCTNIGRASQDAHAVPWFGAGGQPLLLSC